MDRQIVVFTYHTVTRTSIDAAMDRMRKIMDEWPAERPYLAVSDFSYEKSALTPYVRKRFREPVHWRPELAGAVALILPRTFQTTLMRLFIQQFSKRESRPVQIFFTRDKAVAWLKSKL